MWILLTTAWGHPIDAALAALKRVDCENAPVGARPRHPGAERVYAGHFAKQADGRWTGQERRVLHANSSWKALTGLRHGEDCVDVWTTTAEQVPAEECPTCTYGLRVTGVLDPAATTCKRRLTPENNRFTTTYNVTVEGEGVTLAFPSGKVLGTGRLDEGALTWISKQTCLWF
jgi:hypothetical protein